MQFKYVTALSLVLTFSTKAFGQQNPYTMDSATHEKMYEAPPEEVFTFVEQMPEFPGGQTAMQQFLVNNIYYPDSARDKGEQGRVVTQFIVGSDRLVRDAKVMRSVSPEIDAEALRVVNAMPRWIPGRMNGRPVNTQFTLPVMFWLE